MKLFIDTANIEEIKIANQLGAICGVTTNPTLIAKEKRDFKATIKEIAQIVNGPISAEVISLESDKMVKEAIELASIHPNIVIKVPITTEGLKTVKILSDEGIETNVTLIFSVSQALIAARSGATYVSPFIGRLEDNGINGINVVREIAEVFKTHNIKTEIIAASIRHPNHVVNAALAGAHIATVPYKILTQMTEHPLTNDGIKKFLKDWESVKK